MVMTPGIIFVAFPGVFECVHDGLLPLVLGPAEDNALIARRQAVNMPTVGKSLFGLEDHFLFGLLLLVFLLLFFVIIIFITLFFLVIVLFVFVVDFILLFFLAVVVDCTVDSFDLVPSPGKRRLKSRKWNKNAD